MVHTKTHFVWLLFKDEYLRVNQLWLTFIPNHLNTDSVFDGQVNDVNEACLRRRNL